ncbi:MAG: hypothetical protein WEB00_07515 [Dehalococcoidia bacterium]
METRQRAPSLTTVLEDGAAASPSPGLTSPETRQSGRIGDRLVEVGLITREQLQRALHLHESTGIRLGQALLSLDFVSPKDLAVELASQHRLPFFELRGIVMNPAVVGLLPEELCRRHGLLPLTASNTTVTIATTDPTDEEGVAAACAFLDKPLRLVVAMATEVDDILTQYYEERYNDLSTYEFIRRRSPESAYRTLAVGQRAALWSTLVVLGVLALILQTALLAGLAGALVAVLLLADAARLFAALRPASGGSRTAREGMLDRELPVLTVLAPLASVAEIRETLSDISALDYPAAKLDIKLLVPGAAGHAGELPFNVQLIPVPESDKFLGLVLNYGLVKARGEIVTVMRPGRTRHPEEARLAAAALVAYNSTADLAVSPPPRPARFSRPWTQLKALGQFAEWTFGSAIGARAYAASAVYFRTKTLRALGGWDPFDASPQANLALRLRRSGAGVALLPRPQGIAEGPFTTSLTHYAESRMRLWFVHTRSWDRHSLATSWLLLSPWLQAFAWFTLPLCAALSILDVLPSTVAPVAMVGLGADAVAGLLTALILCGRGRLFPGIGGLLAALPYGFLSLSSHVRAIFLVLAGNPRRPWPESHPRSLPEPAPAPSNADLDAMDEAAARSSSSGGSASPSW